MKVKYKLNNVQISKDGICIPTTFLLVKDLSSHELILVTPFLSIFMPFNADYNGIYATVQNHSIIFKFIMQPKHKFINKLKDQIFLKEKQINFLQK